MRPMLVFPGVFCLLLLLASCGGGGGGTPATVNCTSFVDLAPNSVTSGALANGDCTVAMLDPSSGDNSFVDPYRVTLPAPGTLTVELDSAAFDAFLVLASTDLQALVSLDDDSGGGTNARITTTIAAGTYAVLANSFAPGETGPYTLTLTFVPDVWQPTSQAGAPDPRTGHTAVWTGSEMIVWGGHDGNSIAKNTGARFNPETNTWTPLPTLNAPSARQGHTAIWTGTEMIIWGGISSGPGFLVLGDGARYNPQTNVWTEITSVNQPSARLSHTAVWTGSEMIVWGGFSCIACTFPELATGARYDPVNNAWAATALDAVASARGNHTAVWTGTRMIVWGGEIDPAGPSLVGTGAAYDPSANLWSGISATSAPPPTRCHSSVWTGSEMIVFGGQINFSLACGMSSTGTGARYVPATDTWIPIATAPVASTLAGAPAIWSGTRMITWFESQGGRYDPATNAWSGVSSTDAPSARRNHTLIWTGSRGIVWGGEFAGPIGTGGIYDPTSDPIP